MPGGGGGSRAPLVEVDVASVPEIAVVASRVVVADVRSPVVEVVGSGAPVVGGATPPLDAPEPEPVGGSSAVLALVPVSALVVAVVEVTTVAAAPLVPALES